GVCGCAVRALLADVERDMRRILSTAVMLAALLGLAGQAAAAPVAPRDVYAEAPRPDQVVLSWRPGAEPAPDETPTERYQVFRNGELVAETDALKLTDPWLLEQRSYSYVVRAVDP